MSIQILAGTAIIKNNKILLLQQRPDGRHANKWGPPAGHAEGNETPLETAIRETKEETNLDVEILGIAQAGILSSKGIDYLLVMYSSRPQNIKKLKVQEDEVANSVWATLEDLKRDKYPLREKFLKEPLVVALTKEPARLDSVAVYKVEQG